VLLDVLMNVWPVVGQSYHDVGFEIHIVSSKNAVVGFAQNFFPELLG
jgi:hypothetical protein